jgi:hypothetical protein
LIAGCIPPPGAFSPQSGWQGSSQAGGQSEYDDEGDYGGGYDGDEYGGDPSGRSAGSRGSRGSGGSDGSNWWLCTAEASLGTAYGDGPMSYSTERAYGNGPTRDEAYLNALRDCQAMVSMSTSLADSSGQRQEGGTCEISSCMGPGGSH